MNICYFYYTCSLLGLKMTRKAGLQNFQNLGVRFGGTKQDFAAYSTVGNKENLIL